LGQGRGRRRRRGWRVEWEWGNSTRGGRCGGLASGTAPVGCVVFGGSETGAVLGNTKPLPAGGALYGATASRVLPPTDRAGICGTGVLFNVAG
jgi:hypothetical protein